MIADTFYDGDKYEQERILDVLPPTLRFLHKVYVVLLRAMVGIARLNLKQIPQDSSVLRSFISIFDSQFANLESHSPGEFGTIPRNLAP